MKEIKLIVMDIDGTLTDGGIIHNSDSSESKIFSSKDGTILKELYKLNIETMILTGRESSVVTDRGNYMKITYIIQGVENKKNILLSHIERHGINLENIAYIGDDLNDYEAMTLCGFKACPIEAALEIRNICDYISPNKAGHGAMRDICEFILKQNNKYADFLALFGIEN